MSYFNSMLLLRYLEQGILVLQMFLYIDLGFTLNIKTSLYFLETLSKIDRESDDVEMLRSLISF